MSIVAAAVLGAAAANQAAPDRHVALISIDGLAADEYLQPNRCGGIANLRQLMAAGVYARGVAGVLPTVTYPAHATIATGARPAKHGVVNNARLDGAPWHFDRTDIHATPIWDAARAAGLSTAIVTWPSTMGASATYLIPENLSNVATVTDLIRAASTPRLFETLESATAPVHLLPFGDEEAAVPLDRMTASFAVEIVRAHRPNLLMVHFLDFDHRQHSQGPGSAAACAALSGIDAHIGRLRAAYHDAGLDGRATVVVVSDHGFEPLRTSVNLRPAIGDAAGEFDVRLASGSAAYYAKAGVAPARLTELLAAIRTRVESQLHGIVRWMTGDEAARIGGFPGAAFVLCAAPGYALTRSLPPDVATAPSTGRGAHGHCPDEPGIDAAFIAAGAGVRPAGALPRMRMIDVGPTVAALLGVTLPDAEGEPVPLAGK